jgi:hypothetical protein
MERLLTRVQVADMLGTSVMTIIRIAEAGDLTAIKLVNKPTAMTRYSAAEVQALVAKRRRAAEAKPATGKHRRR